MPTTRRNRNRRNRSNRRNRRTNNALVGGRGIFSTIYSPVSHFLRATGKGFGAVTNMTRNMGQRGLRGVDNIGSTVTSHANLAVRNLVSRKRRGSRRNRRN